ncbi:SAM-dependent methyltransferase [Bacteroidales bacterium OttesenSCG-928-K03]|nr:SAM-dependent methyltransferase [Bacteroidales bacterium OttesenSCG-928-L14]MDL2240320.1 SAM-dependent methyltransferase [Bacteroidales bacterium OttesenSCG-928-K22]MDL2243154.1 SAM-dependent methyltransferase [Bacteroidales bacterium OttesenSCG-928-K03]
MKKNYGTLFLVPSLIGDNSANTCIPDYNVQLINTITHFIVEEEKSAYKILRKIGFNQSFDNVIFYVFNEHSNNSEIQNYLKPLENGLNIGLLSEAGLPCIADPGNMIVRAAHENNIKVVPLVGPNSIVSALISSGFNGQNFAFNGYLPIKSPAKENRIKQLEKVSQDFTQTQIFIEAPYRNIQLFKTLLTTCNPNTSLCIASNIHCSDEFILTKTIFEWNLLPLPDINKKPTVFLIER